MTGSGRCGHDRTMAPLRSYSAQTPHGCWLWPAVALSGLALMVLNCGGKSDGDTADGSGGAPSTGGTSSSTSTGNSGGTASTSSSVPSETSARSQIATAPPSTCANQPRPSCISSCAEQNPRWLDVECIEDHWRCPGASVDRASCPANTCAVNYESCCDRVTGETTNVPCGPDGTVMECPSGTRPMQTQCIPDGLNVGDCWDLSELPCDTFGQKCGGHGLYCQCEGTRESNSTDDSSIWVCMIDLV